MAAPRWAWGWIALFLLAASLPFGIGLFAAPEDAAFTGVLINRMDTHSYYANMREGAAGRWLYTLPYTAQESKPVPLFMVYILLGHAARITGLSIPLVFHLARIVCGGVFALAAYHFIAHTLPDQAERRLAFGLLLFTGGIGWIMIVIFGANLSGDLYEIPDLWISDAVSFTAALSNPHFTLNMALIMGMLVWGDAFIRGGRRRDGVLALLAGAGIAFVHAHQLAVVWAVLGISAAWRVIGPIPDATFCCAPPFHHVGRGYKALIPLGRLAILGVPTALLAGALTLTTRGDPYLKSWLDQGDTYSPPVWTLPILYGPVLILALAGVWLTLKAERRGAARPAVGVQSQIGACCAQDEREPARPYTSNDATCHSSLLPVALWFGVVLVLIYVPVNFQRRFMEGWHVPVVILAAAGWRHVIAPRLRPAAARRVLAAGLIAVMLSPLFVLTGTLVTLMQTDNPDVYISADEQGALRVLAREADRVVFAALESGNRLPARADVRTTLGHWSLTAFAADRYQEAERFFDASTPDADRIAILARLGAEYVWFSDDERASGDFDPGAVAYLEAVYTSPTVSLYRVRQR